MGRAIFRAIPPILSACLAALAMLLSPAAPARAEETAVPHTFAYFVAPRPGLMEQMTDAEKQAIGAHFTRLKGMLADGSLILAGPTDPPTIGIVIFKAADLAAAKALAESDPAVTAGAFTLKSVEAFSLALERPGPLPHDYVAQPTARVLHKQVL